ncbi:MAG: YdcF family protein [Candidatus Omnitrophica bacterium]|nr:YdcF family protein [Candidatus Omnitrophota bacterium]
MKGFSRNALLISLFLCVFLLCSISAAVPRCSDTAIVVLGTRPLDDVTPSLDMIRRVEKGIELHVKYPNAVLIFTGGMTAGPVSEARMMAELAAKEGIPAGSLIFEEQSRSTEENARFTAQLVLSCSIKRTILVTRPGHLRRATRTFGKYRVFGNIQPAASRISKNEIIRNLQEYLTGHQSTVVQQILEKVMRE